MSQGKLDGANELSGFSSQIDGSRGSNAGGVEARVFDERVKNKLPIIMQIAERIILSPCSLLLLITILNNNTEQ
ncbi:Uncharacterised protein [Citrobacter freundii]|nr:Uncharacterised protein [Citrobacter freundii]